MPHILILGGGFGGLAAVATLQDRFGGDVDITLVDRAERFFMGFAKLWDLAGVRPLDQGSRPLDALGSRGVRFVQADVTGIDATARRVETTDGSFQADAVLVALGAPASPAHTELLTGPGAFDLYDAASLPAIRQELDRMETGRVLVALLGAPFKCPPAPFEAVLIIDELFRHRGVRHRIEVSLSTFQPMTLPVAGPDASQYVAQHLDQRGIQLLTGRSVADIDGDDRVVRFDDGSTAPYDLLLGVPASVAPTVIAESGLASASGWIEPDRATLRTSFDGVYAAGDCTLVPTAKGQLPKAGVFAAAEAEVAAANIAADLGMGEAAIFEGRGFCFLELPGRQVALVEGNFLSDPPDVRLTDADEANFDRKQAYERDRLAAWLG